MINLKKTIALLLLVTTIGCYIDPSFIKRVSELTYSPMEFNVQFPDEGMSSEPVLRICLPIRLLEM